MSDPSHIVSPEDALELMEDEGYAYLDVRTEAEFDGGHPTGAYNIPLRLRGGAGMVPNDAFLQVVKATFPLDAKLVVGCQMGGRSQAAVALLTQAGFTNLRDVSAGWGGKKDAFGGTAELGWQACGLPIGLRAEPGRDYAALREKAGL
ncbi:MAG: rhodanese-like domain-containing protein [Myxococcales bacterium]|nr:rhodanese-like domain-containing protein [Myxococcales bacterium]MCB9629605.1 rhodanese-like domain-containing protein [Sandaracinaceae bacterium]